MLSETLKNLCESLKQGKFKSKQACFNYHIDSVNDAIKFHSWDEIAAFINENTGSHISVETYRFMAKKARANKKGSIFQESTKPETKNTTLRKNESKAVFSNVSEKQNTIEHNPEADLKKFEDKYK